MKLQFVLTQLVKPIVGKYYRKTKCIKVIKIKIYLFLLVMTSLTLFSQKNNSSEVNILIKKADKLNDSGKYKKANETYTEVLKLNKNLQEVYSKRAGTYFQMQQYDNAIIDFTKAIESKAEDMSNLYFLRGLSKTLLKREDKEGACSDISKELLNSVSMFLILMDSMSIVELKNSNRCRGFVFAGMIQFFASASVSLVSFRSVQVGC